VFLLLRPTVCTLAIPSRIDLDTLYVQSSPSFLYSSSIAILKMNIHRWDPSARPNCNTYKQPLHEVHDRQMSTGDYWRNCQACRDINTSERRMQYGRGPVRHFQNLSTYERAAQLGGIQDLGMPGDQDKTKIIGSSFGGTDFEFHTLQRPKTPPRGSQRTPQGSSFAEIGNGWQPSYRAKVDGKTKQPKCSVCDDECSTTDFPRLTRCSHEPDVCGTCFEGWLDSRMQNTSWDRIKCPTITCSILLNDGEMQLCALPVTYMRYAILTTTTIYELTRPSYRYQELSARSVLNNDPEFQNCLRPGCSSGQFHKSESDGNIFCCHECGFLVCTTHNESFHTGETCKEYDCHTKPIRKVEDDASVRKIERTAKKCPGNACGIWIQKNQGCDYMTCKSISTSSSRSHDGS
jgi:hypothetical protein